MLRRHILGVFGKSAQARQDISSEPTNNVFDADNHSGEWGGDRDFVRIFDTLFVIDSSPCIEPRATLQVSILMVSDNLSEGELTRFDELDGLFAGDKVRWDHGG